MWAKAPAERICWTPTLEQASPSRCIRRCPTWVGEPRRRGRLLLRVTRRSSHAGQSCRSWFSSKGAVGLARIQLAPAARSAEKAGASNRSPTAADGRLRGRVSLLATCETRPIRERSPAFELARVREGRPFVAPVVRERPRIAGRAQRPLLTAAPRKEQQRRRRRTAEARLLLLRESSALLASLVGASDAVWHGVGGRVCRRALRADRSRLVGLL